MKKLPLTLLAGLTAVSGFAASMDSRVSQLEKGMDDVRVETALGTYGMLTAPARPDVDGWGWFASLSAIYQRTRVKGTEFAYTDDDPTGTPPIHGRTKEIDFDWDWGIKAGLGYNFEHDNWDIYLNYMWLDTSGSKSVSSGLNSSVIPLKGFPGIVNGCLAPFGNFTFATIAKSQFDADYNILNLELGRNYFISPKIAFRPHWGLQSSWIDLEQVVRYSGGELPVTTNQDGGIGVNTVHVRDDSDFWGLGPRVGINTKWFIGKGFNIFGDAAGALLFGRMDVDHREKFSLCPEESRISIDANRHQFVPTMQLTMGLGWDRYFNDNQNHVMLRVGFDSQYFWRANQMLRIDDAASLKYERISEDLGIYGLTIDARLDF